MITKTLWECVRDELKDRHNEDFEMAFLVLFSVIFSPLVFILDVVFSPLELLYGACLVAVKSLRKRDRRKNENKNY